MNCVKCGRDIDEDQMFCESCLKEMEKYPVKPDAVVLIPTRPAGPGAKKVHQKRQTPEEQIAALEKKCRRLFTALVLSLLLLLAALVVTGVSVYELDVHRFLGQNYITAEQTETVDPALNCDH